MEAELIRGGPLKEYSREQLLERLSGSWKGRSIFALLEVPRFQANPRELAEQLAISLDEVFFYLDLLIALDLVKTTSGHYERTTDTLDFRNMGLNKAEQLRNFSLISSEVLSRQTTDGRCLWESAIILSNMDLVKDFLRKFNSLVDDFEEKSKQASDKNFLFGMSAAFGDLLEAAHGGGSGK